MTERQFLNKVRTVKGWNRTHGGAIRRNGRCPMEVIGKVSKGMYPEAAAKLGISRRLCDKILLAADLMNYPGRLRTQLLKACGLA